MVNCFCPFSDHCIQGLLLQAHLPCGLPRPSVGVRFRAQDLMQRPVGAWQPAATDTAAQAATAAGSEDSASAGSGDEAYAAVSRALRDSDEDADTRAQEARSAAPWLSEP